jgi:hypothetical protein
MHIILFLAYFWSFAFLLVLLPGMLIGWPLRRYAPHLLIIPIATEALILGGFVWDLANLGWNDETVSSLVRLHVYLSVPILLAVSAGYFGPRYIITRFRA